MTDLELLRALRVLVAESIGDFTYSIRDRVLGDPDFVGSTWDHPRVKAWSDASQVVERYVKAHEDEDA